MTASTLVRLSTAAAALLLLGACSSSGDTDASDGEPTGSAANGVTIAGFIYDPSPLTVPAGTTVTWTNQDEILHTVTSGSAEAPATEPLDGSLDGPGSTYEYTFAESGTFDYFCARHNSMTGSVTVT